MIDLEQKPQRPTAQTSPVLVEGDMWQAVCVCRWRGRRKHSEDAARLDGKIHETTCGLCQTARALIEQCSCMNCQRTRDFRRQQQRSSSG
jgi:hypothetical protein